MALAVSVVHRLEATGSTLLFGDGSNRNWNTKRERALSKNGSEVEASIVGIATQGGFSQVAV